MLLVDYLEKAAHYLEEETSKLQEINRIYRKTLDRDLLAEMAIIRKKMRTKRSEVVETIYSNMDEFRSIHRYFPDLFDVFLEDPYIGRILSGKKWLLGFKSMDAKEANKEFESIKKNRAMLKAARRDLLKKKIAKLSEHFLSSHPVLLKRVGKGVAADDALKAIETTDRELRTQGWLVLLTSSLINIPIQKFFGIYLSYLSDEERLMRQEQEASGRGTVAEANASKRTALAKSRKARAARRLSHLILSNPAFLKDIRARQGWTKKPESGSIESFIKGLEVHFIREKPWLDEMRDKLKR